MIQAIKLTHFFSEQPIYLPVKFSSLFLNYHNFNIFFQQFWKISQFVKRIRFSSKMKRTLSKIKILKILAGKSLIFILLNFCHLEFSKVSSLKEFQSFLTKTFLYSRDIFFTLFNILYIKHTYLLELDLECYPLNLSICHNFWYEYSYDIYDIHKPFDFDMRIPQRSLEINQDQKEVIFFKQNSGTHIFAYKII